MYYNAFKIWYDAVEMQSNKRQHKYSLDLVRFMARHMLRIYKTLKNYRLW